VTPERAQPDSPKHSNFAGCFGEPGFVARRTAARWDCQRAAALRRARRKPASAFAGGRFQASDRRVFIAFRSFITMVSRIAVAMRAL
jgi:hypothetical protein